MKVVLDTNVLVSALMKPNGIEAKIVLLAFRGNVELWVSPAILAEYERVLPRPELKLNPSEVEATLASVRKTSRLVNPNHAVKISPDEPDNRFLECAEAAKADYLVTGNARHFPQSHKQTRIIAGRELLNVLAKH